MIDYELYGDGYATPEVRAIFDERAMIQRWLDVEAALASAQGELGLIPTEAATAIARAARVERLDLAAVKRDVGVTAHPLVPVLRELTRAAGEHGGWVHWGATTQDIMDTGMVLQLKDVHAILRQDLVRIVQSLGDLAVAHRETVMAGRTHGQQALPITFGYKVAVWIAEVMAPGRTARRRRAAAPRR